MFRITTGNAPSIGIKDMAGKIRASRRLAEKPGAIRSRISAASTPSNSRVRKSAADYAESPVMKRGQKMWQEQRENSLSFRFPTLEHFAS